MTDELKRSQLTLFDWAKSQRKEMNKIFANALANEIPNDPISEKPSFKELMQTKAMMQRQGDLIASIALFKLGVDDFANSLIEYLDGVARTEYRLNENCFLAIKVGELNLALGCLRRGEYVLKIYSDLQAGVKTPRDAATEIAKYLSNSGKSGAEKRHAPMRSLKDWTLSQYYAGSWPSANKAAHDLKEKVLAHGRKIDAHLSPENAQRTIAEWIRKSV